MHRFALIFLSCSWLMTGHAQNGQLLPDEILPDEDGMLSFEAFVLPEPDYTVEVIIFRNLNTGYNREEDWSKPELRVIELPADDEPAEDGTGDSKSDPYGDNFFADVDANTDAANTDAEEELAQNNMPDDLESDDLVPDGEPLDCPALIETALLMEGSAPQECIADIVRFIPAEPSLLAEAFLALENTADYRPLAILAWSQSGYARSESPVFELRPLGQVGNSISGTVSLSRGRYLHLELDLSFVPGLDFESETDSRSATMALVAEQMDETETYQLNESRRMRRDEIHYFDHPEFAALAIVTRYEPPPEEEITEISATTAGGN